MHIEINAYKILIIRGNGQLLLAVPCIPDWLTPPCTEKIHNPQFITHHNTLREIHNAGYIMPYKKFACARFGCHKAKPKMSDIR